MSSVFVKSSGKHFDSFHFIANTRSKILHVIYLIAFLCGIFSKFHFFFYDNIIVLFLYNIHNYIYIIGFKTVQRMPLETNIWAHVSSENYVTLKAVFHVIPVLWV